MSIIGSMQFMILFCSENLWQTEGNVIQDMQRFYPKISLLPYIPQIYFWRDYFHGTFVFLGNVLG